jgi:hypothetical protein
MILLKNQIVVEIPIGGRLEWVSGANSNMRIALRHMSMN